jgi:hypothetical protein
MLLVRHLVGLLTPLKLLIPLGVILRLCVAGRVVFVETRTLRLLRAAVVGEAPQAQTLVVTAML